MLMLFCTGLTSIVLNKYSDPKVSNYGTCGIETGNSGITNTETV